MESSLRWRDGEHRLYTLQRRAKLLELYLDSLESALGRSVDRRQFFRAWDLACLRTFVIAGYCLADAASPSQ